MKRRCVICLAGLMLTAAAVLLAVAPPRDERLPGAGPADRRLVRVWMVSPVGGGESWLRACLKEWEAAHPGVMTYLRAVSAEELAREIDRLAHRITTTTLIYSKAALMHTAAMIEEDPIDYEALLEKIPQIV